MAAILRPEATPDDFSRRAEGFLPGWFGMRVTAITPGRLEMELPIKREMLAPNGFLRGFRGGAGGYRAGSPPSPICRKAPGASRRSS